MVKAFWEQLVGKRGFSLLPDKAIAISNAEFVPVLREQKMFQHLVLKMKDTSFLHSLGLF